jgi:hypothetical protein
MCAHWHANGHVEWNARGPDAAALLAEVKVMQNAVWIAGDARLSEAIMFSSYDRRLWHGKG